MLHYGSYFLCYPYSHLYNSIYFINKKGAIKCSLFTYLSFRKTPPFVSHEKLKNSNIPISFTIVK